MYVAVSFDAPAKQNVEDFQDNPVDHFRTVYQMLVHSIRSTDTPGLPEEASHTLLSFLYGEASQVCKNPPRDEQPGSYQDPLQKVQRAP